MGVRKSERQSRRPQECTTARKKKARRARAVAFASFAPNLAPWYGSPSPLSQGISGGQASNGSVAPNAPPQVTGPAPAVTSPTFAIPVETSGSVIVGAGAGSRFSSSPLYER